MSCPNWLLIPTLAAVGLGVLIPLAHAHDETRGTGYEPCHLLCSNEAGRTEGRSVSERPGGRFGLRLESVYVDPRGVYLDDGYRGIEPGADAFAVQFLSSVWWHPTPRWRVVAGMPWEYNRASGVALPTLNPTDEESSELEPGGVFASVHVAVTGDDAPVAVWTGLGYRLSKPLGTSDISRDDLATNPDKALEGLGVGSDDIYVSTSLSIDGPVSGSVVGGGAEGRIHMLPRWQTHFGTTAAWRLYWSQSLSQRVAASLRLGGYTTWLHTLDTVQYSLLVPSAEVGFQVIDSVRIFGNASTEIPSEAVNRNSLQTWNAGLGAELGF